MQHKYAINCHETYRGPGRRSNLKGLSTVRKLKKRHYRDETEGLIVEGIITWAVVRAPSSHCALLPQCGPDSIPGPGVHT